MKCEPGCTCGRHNRRIYAGQPVHGPLSLEEKREYHRRYRAANREKLNEQSRIRYAANDGWRESKRRSRQKNREQRREYGRRNSKRFSLQALYGLSLERWRQMFADQQGLCYLCGDPLDTGQRRGIHVDHDHSCCPRAKSCGVCVRGLACRDCNLGVGRLGDDPERIRRIAGNLEAANRRLALERAS